MKGRSELYLLMLLGLLGSSQAFSQRQCGAPPKNNMLYESMPSEHNGPEPRVVRVSKEHNRELIWVTYNHPAPNGRDNVTSAVRSQNAGITWQPEPKYQETGFLNSEKASVVYRLKGDDSLERSRDSGIQWVGCRLNVNGLNVSEFAKKTVGSQRATVHFGFAAVNPQNPATIYGTFSLRDPYNSQPAQQSVDLPGLYVSYDSCDNWTVFAPNLKADRPDERALLGIDPSNPDRMIGHAKSGLVLTMDGGKSWSPVGQQADLEAPAELKGRREDLAKRNDGASIALYPEFTYLALLQVEFQQGNSNVIYLVTNKGLYKTEDSSRTWRLIYAGAPSYYELNSLFIDPKNPNRLFVGTRDRILISEDGGCRFRTFFDWKTFVGDQQATAR